MGPAGLDISRRDFEARVAAMKAALKLLALTVIAAAAVVVALIAAYGHMVSAVPAASAVPRRASSAQAPEGANVLLCEFRQIVDQYGPAVLTVDGEASPNVRMSQ
jgi:hypothetical protein